MDDTYLSEKESQVIDRIIAGETTSIERTDINALVGGLIHATADVSTAVLNAVCADKELRAAMVSQLNNAAQATINDDSDNVRQLLSSNEANSEAIRNLIKNIEVSDERLRLCFSELRYYDSQKQNIVAEQRQYKEQVRDRTIEIEQHIASKDNIVIPKAAVYEGIKAIAQNPYTWKLIGDFISNLLH